MQTTSNQVSNTPWHHWLLAALGMVAILFLFADTFVRDVITRQEITLVIKGKYHGVVFTNQGTYGFIEKGRGRGLLRDVNFAFWNDGRKEIQPQLTLGCSYRVKTVGGGLAGRQPLGENRMPPLNKIVKIVKRMEATEQECDVSARSGKPVCRDDQVVDDKKHGLFVKARDCDFETYQNNKVNWAHHR